MIDTVLSKVKAGLDGIKDHRMQSGNLQHTLGDTLMSAFAMFHLKDRPEHYPGTTSGTGIGGAGPLESRK